MMKITKILTLAVALFLFAVPAKSWAAYESLYANAADPIFAGNLWTGFEEITLDGANYAYHVWYEQGDVRADYYIAYYDTYTNEYLLYYSSDNDQQWGYWGATDGSYERAWERVNNTSSEWWELEYEIYSDAYMSYFLYDFDSADLYYYVEEEYLPSVYVGLSYRYETEDLEWYYYYENDVSYASIWERAYLWDPANGVEYYYNRWESTETGSYAKYAWDYEGTATKNGSWSWDYDKYTESSESFSAALSSFASSFEQYTYSEGSTDTHYYEWKNEIYDSGYYDYGYDWYDYANDYRQEYSEGKYQDYGTDWFYTYFQAVQYEDDMWSWWNRVWDYEYSYEENLFTSEFSFYEDTEDIANDTRYQKYSGYRPDSGYYEGYDYYYEPDDYRYYEGIYSETWDNGGSYSYQYVEARAIPGTVLSWGEGFNWYEENSYDSSIQQTYYYTSYDEYAKTGRNTYSYYYYEYALTDADDKSAYWQLRTRDGETNQILTYEYYWYNLTSDTGNEDWYYDKEDRTGVNYTYYNESHYLNLFTGAYNDYEYFSESGVFYTSTSEGQNLDIYYLNTQYRDYIKDTYYESQYDLFLASGNQIFDAFYGSEWVLNAWNKSEQLELDYLTDHWTGFKITHDSGVYDLYLYTSYPDDFFLIENFKY